MYVVWNILLHPPPPLHVRCSLRGPDIISCVNFSHFSKLHSSLNSPPLGQLFSFPSDSFILRNFCANARRISSDKSDNVSRTVGTRYPAVTPSRGFTTKRHLGNDASDVRGVKPENYDATFPCKNLRF